MRRFAVRWLITIVPLLLVVSFVVFMLTSFVAGDIALRLAGETASPSVLEAIRSDLSLDDPVWTRYLDWLFDALRGDLGRSFQTNESVSDLIVGRIGVTLSLLVLTMVIGITVGAAVGITSALRRGGLADRMLSVVLAVLVAAPALWIGLVLISFLAIQNRWLPATGYVPISDGFVDWIRYMILPALALSGVLIAEVARQLRLAMIENVTKDYVLTARAKGLPPRLIYGKHVLKNASIPVLTVVSFRAVQLIGGTVVVEKVFNIRGIGSAAADAAVAQDIPVVLGVVVITTLAFVVVNLLTDIAYGYLNPKALVR